MAVKKVVRADRKKAEWKNDMKDWKSNMNDWKVHKNMDNCNTYKWHHHCSNFGAGYGLGFIGALIYFLSVATSFWTVVIGILKSIVWPVFLVYGLLKFIGA